MYSAPNCEYVRPATVADALAALGRYDEGDAVFVAGGQSLMQAVKARLVRPRCLIDLQAVDGLSGIDVGADGVRIGPMTRYVEIARDERLGGAYGALRDAAERVGDRQVRNRGTIGGSLCWNYVAACTPPTAIGLGAELELTAADGATRTLAAEDFIGGPLETAREDNEILTAITIPAARGSAGSAYKKWGLVTDALPVIGSASRWRWQTALHHRARRVGGLANGPPLWRRRGGAAASLPAMGRHRGGTARPQRDRTQENLWPTRLSQAAHPPLGRQVTATALRERR